MFDNDELTGISVFISVFIFVLSWHLALAKPKIHFSPENKSGSLFWFIFYVIWPVTSHRGPGVHIDSHQ